jgi:pimeloyl-ACP methyl ester carboxylesterase
VNGPRVAVHTLVEGPPGAPLAVLAHGLEDSWECWVPLARRFAGWRVVALDLPWRPGNDYRWRHRPPSTWLALALELVGGHPDTVVAHSFGANATLELLCGGEDPGWRAAALICPLYRPPEVALTWEVFDTSRRTFEAHMRDGLLTRLGRRAARMDPDVFAKMVATAIDRVGPAAFLAVFEQFSASALLPLARVDLPTLVLAGGADPTLSRRAATALVGALPRGSVTFDDHYDHFCHVRHAAEVAAKIQSFVDTVPGPAARSGQPGPAATSAPRGPALQRSEARR